MANARLLDYTNASTMALDVWAELVDVVHANKGRDLFLANILPVIIWIILMVVDHWINLNTFAFVIGLVLVFSWPHKVRKLLRKHYREKYVNHNLAKRLSEVMKRTNYHVSDKMYEITKEQLLILIDIYLRELLP